MHRYFLTFALAGLLISCSQEEKSKANRAETSKPNIVIILADDLGYGDLGVNGSNQIKTPAIYALAKGGVSFTQFYASANICTPSRAGLMTGRYSIRTSLGYNVITVYYRRLIGALEKFYQLDGFTSPYELLFPAAGAGGEEYSHADRHPNVVTKLKKELAAARQKFVSFRTHEPDKTFPE